MRQTLLPMLAVLAALSLPAAAPAQPPASPADHDGAHDFDFLHGDWKARLRQLDKPLTGSTTWVEYEGISRTHKVLDTSANFEEFAVRPTGAAGKPKKGQTLRLYNPETREWSIYLVDADKGQLPLPATVGRFKDGKGEFYDMELWNGRTILVRYQWTPGKPGPHFEQAFSADGGRSWEVNWVLDLTPER